MTKLPKENFLSSLLPRLQEEKTQQFATLVMTLTAIGIFSFFAISPTLSTIAQLNKQLQDNQFVDQKLTEKIANLATLQQKYAKLQNDIPVVLNAIPVTPEMAILVGQIQTIAQQSNVDLQQIQTYPVDITTVILPPEASTAYAISYDLRGAPQDLETFLGNLIAFDRLITIDNISASKETANETVMRMTVKGNAYFKQQ
ncbi:MAG: type 4a pilus biogenesis protein PilO [Patescibacteria group bacterium]|nr:type 4a pilus biogenesis protein PilO [Patescibacteria group bacterium]